MAGKNHAKTRITTKSARPGKKAEPAARSRAKKQAAAPLLATAPKKVGKTSAKSADAVKPAAPYQPKTGGASSTVARQAARAAASPAFDPLALARPWMRLGVRMAMSNLALQARMISAIMDFPPTAAAMRQGSAAYKAGLAMLESAGPGKR
jgi:hypothetical protein